MKGKKTMLWLAFLVLLTGFVSLASARCVDSDAAAENPYLVKGVCSDGKGTYVDYCIECKYGRAINASEKLVEYYCNATTDECVSKTICCGCDFFEDCPVSHCADGACVRGCADRPGEGGGPGEGPGDGGGGPGRGPFPAIPGSACASDLVARVPPEQQDGLRYAIFVGLGFLIAIGAIGALAFWFVRVRGSGGARKK